MTPVSQAPASQAPVPQAIIWDYDGTLVDSRLKNLHVTRAIITAITGKEFHEFEALASPEKLEEADSRAKNWRELNLTEFGLTEAQNDQSGVLWTSYQLKDDTPTFVFEGISQVLEKLQALPQGIVSQNSKANIVKVLSSLGLSHYFDCVVGYEEVDFGRQKPAPDGLLRCLEELTRFEPGLVYYIGDHETDAQCAALANAALKQREIELEVLSIGAFYGQPRSGSDWPVKPDFSVSHPAEIVSIVNSNTRS